MCTSSAGKFMDPAKLLSGSSQKWADPLGITNTVIGDPTGSLRRQREQERVRKDIANGGPEKRAQAAFVQDQYRQMEINKKTALGA